MRYCDSTLDHSEPVGLEASLDRLNANRWTFSGAQGHSLCVYTHLQMCVRVFCQEKSVCKQQQLWNVFLMFFLADSTK